jgi:hypothetical protein
MHWFGRRVRRPSSDDVVVLDGPFAQLPWPVEEAEALLADATPWGLGEYERGPTQDGRLCRLAQYVDGYQHGHEEYEWVSSVLDGMDAGSSARYHTQDLLDVLFFMCRAEHFNTGSIKDEEPRLRRVLQEVVRRVRSDHPPRFVLGPKKS